MDDAGSAKMPDVVSGDESAEPLIANGSEPSDEGQGRVTGSDDGIAASGVDAAESSSDDIPAGESSLGDGGTRTDSTPGSLSSLFRAASTDEPAAENFSPADGRETTEQ